MHIKNLTDKDLPLKLKGYSYILKANSVTTIPDGITTIGKLIAIFGTGKLVEVDDGPNVSMSTNQVELEAGVLYCTQGSMELGNPRLFVGLDGAVNVYGSDSKEIPESVDDMALPEENEDVSGLRVFGALPKYIAFMYTSGEPEIILSNAKVIDCGEI